MSTLLIFLAGILFLAGVLFIKSRVMQNKTWKNVAVWTVFVVWFFITCIGVSFVYINASVGHVKATSTAIFLFGGISVVFAVALARALGFIGVKKKANESIQA
ncbi:MAG: dehalogenase [Peptococcaceae bacterium]|nr:dehalogenase [Peptococcaceae bacterium]